MQTIHRKDVADTIKDCTNSEKATALKLLIVYVASLKRSGHIEFLMERI